MVQARDFKGSILRVAFTMIGNVSWTAGANYLENLLSVIAENSELNITPILFVGEDVDPIILERFIKYLSVPPVYTKVFNDDKLMIYARLFCSYILQRDFFVENEFKQYAIDVVFQHGNWYGCYFRINTLAWIPDFQHKHLPKMFSWIKVQLRNIDCIFLSKWSTRILVSSEDAKNDCEYYFPKSKGRISVMPFSVKAPEFIARDSLHDVVNIYNLPKRFYYLPNQLWAHKNHIGILQGLKVLVASGSDVVIVATGNPVDNRNPKYPKMILEFILDNNLQNNFIFLGLIPHHHVFHLMRNAVAVINPSFFEGWSTSVEEAKSLGIPLLLSDIRVHKEQAGEMASYFNPNDPIDIASSLNAVWSKQDVPNIKERELAALSRYELSRKKFVKRFHSIITGMTSV